MRSSLQFAVDLVGERRAFPDLAADTRHPRGIQAGRLPSGLSPGPGWFAKPF